MMVLPWRGTDLSVLANGLGIPGAVCVFGDAELVPQSTSRKGGGKWAPSKSGSGKGWVYFLRASCLILQHDISAKMGEDSR